MFADHPQLVANPVAPLVANNHPQPQAAPEPSPYYHHPPCSVFEVEGESNVIDNNEAGDGSDVMDEIEATPNTAGKLNVKTEETST